MTLEAAGEAVRLPGALRCRRPDQSALLTFRDPDGSLGAAGVLRPRAGKGTKRPVVVPGVRIQFEN